MSFDFSCHVVDPSLIRERIVPYLLGRGDISDLIERANRVVQVERRTQQWRSALYALNREIEKRQSTFIETYSKTPTFFGKLFESSSARAKRLEWMSAKPTGIVGYGYFLFGDGRPFLMSADSTREILQQYQQYLNVDPNNEQAIDELARVAIRHIESQRERAPEIEPEALKNVLDKYYPLLEEIQLDETEKEDNLLAPILKKIDLGRKAIAVADEDEVIDVIDGVQKVYPSEHLSEVPRYCIDFYSKLMPPWKGISAFLFDEIDVDVSHLFSKPLDLFQELIDEVPDIAEVLYERIPENYCVGGYIPPSKVEEFVSLLHRHKDALILNWQESFANSPIPGELDPSHWLKLVECATYALENGLGFLEGTEIDA